MTGEKLLYLGCLFHKFREKGVGDWQPDQAGICSDADTVAALRGEVTSRAGKFSFYRATVQPSFMIMSFGK